MLQLAASGSKSACLHDFLSGPNHTSDDSSRTLLGSQGAGMSSSDGLNAFSPGGG